MTYVVGDIHGNYRKYKRLLKEIDFTDKDDLYVIGDMLDIGDEPISLLRDMSMRINVFPILGDREYIFLEMIGTLKEKEFKENEKIKNWLADGGATTLEEFLMLSNDEREALVEYLCDLPLYEDITVGTKRYILVHAGLDGYKKDRNLDDYGPEELIFKKADIKKCYFDDAFLISGHEQVTDEAQSPQTCAVRKNGHICIDCGAALGNRLCAICLDNGNEYYI